MAKRRPPIQANWAGIRYQYNLPFRADEQRLKSRCTITNPLTGEKEKTFEIKGSSEEEVIEKIKNAVFEYRAAHQREIEDGLRSGKLDLTYIEWMQAYEDRFMNSKGWVRKRENVSACWESVLRPMIGDLKISSLLRKVNPIPELMEERYRRKSTKREVSDEELLCWEILSAIGDCLIDQGILPVNPVRAAYTKLKKDKTEKQIRAFTARSMALEETTAYIREALQERDPAYSTAMVLRAISGLDVYEICGLNMKSFKYAAKLGNSWLEITCRYYQKRNQDPELQPLQSLNEYRKCPCSSYEKQLIGRYQKERRRNGAQPDDPLFAVHGKRMEPESLKKRERAILNRVLKNSPFDHLRGDFIQENALFWMRQCGMTEAKLALIKGIDRVQMYAQWYVDWGNELVLLSISKQKDRWHSRILKPVRDAKRRDWSAQDKLLKISSTTNGKLLIHSTGGLTATITPVVLQQADLTD